MTFNNRFTVGEYFDAGVFLGKATIGAAIVVFLILFAVEASNGGQQLYATLLAAPYANGDEFTLF